MRIPGAAEGRAIFFEHRLQHPQARADRELEELGPRIDEQIDERDEGDSTTAEGTTVRDFFMAAPGL